MSLRRCDICGRRYDAGRVVHVCAAWRQPKWLRDMKRAVKRERKR